MNQTPQRTPRWISTPLFTAIAVAVLGCLMTATIFRNRVWATPITFWSDAVSKSPAKLRPRINLARAYQQSGQYDRAISEYNTASMLALLPSTPIKDRTTTRQLAATNLAQIYIAHNQYQLAEEVLVRVWNEEPGFPGIAANLAVVYLHQSRTQFALEVLDAGIANLPAYPWFTAAPDLYFNRGVTRQLLGDCIGGLQDIEYARTTGIDMPIAAKPNYKGEVKLCLAQ